MWRSWARKILLVLSGVLAVSLVYVLITRTESVPPPVTTGTLAHEDAGIERFSFTQAKAGTVQWHVQAQRARMIEAEHRALLEDVEVTLYGQHGWELKLKGDEGTIDTANKNFTLVQREGPIAVRLQNGYIIYTNHLTWTDDRGEVRTEDPVRIVGDGMEVKGRGLIGKLASEEFRILDDVHVEIVQ
ncbi:LPS export ABC transporter periplasmic protein LptC [Candidatus Nitrospira bockiana]